MKYLLKKFLFFTNFISKQIKKISNGKSYSFCDKLVFIKWKYKYYILRENYSISRCNIYLHTKKELRALSKIYTIGNVLLYKISF